MYKSLFRDKSNQVFEADIVRYFKYENDYYLIYTLNEVDEKNYNILYLVEILEELGEIISVNIKDDEKWKGMQKIVKEVIKQLKNKSNKTFEDLEYNELENVKIVQPRFFKLDSKLANILATNYLIDTDEIDEIEMEEQIEEIEFEEIQPIPLPDTMVVLPPKEVIERKDNMEEIKVIETNDTDKIDYKTLYYLLKEEKDATDRLLDALTEQLMKYKEKYGELE